MKKTITIISLLTLTFAKAQILTSDFESFTLTPNSFYKDTNSVDFSTANATFEYEWTKAFGGYWSAGFAYTNKTDTSNGTFTNLYGCAAFKGYNNSNNYLAAQDGAIIKLITPNNYVNGFWITNSTYAYKTMKNGGGPAKKFGGTSGNDADWFKVTVKGYLGGTIKTDSSVYYLADYRFANNSFDYILKSWNWVNCSNLGNVDSIVFHLSSSDTAGGFGMNNPAFFCMDNFTTNNGVGINEISLFENLKLYPNPFSSVFTVQSLGINGEITKLKITNILGIEIKIIELNSENSEIDLSDFNSGIYFAVLENKGQKKTYKIIKN